MQIFLPRESYSRRGHFTEYFVINWIFCNLYVKTVFEYNRQFLNFSSQFA